MEKRETHYKQQPRRKSQIGYPGGANIGDLIVAGGALAVAGFVAFALRRRKRTGGSQTPEKQESEQGLGFVIQSSPSNPCCSGTGSIKVVATQTITCELVATEMIKEQKSACDIQCNCREEISVIGKDYEKVLLSDDSKKDGPESCELHGDFKEFSMPKPKNIENDSEVTQVVKEGKPTDAAEGKKTERTSSKSSVTLEEKDDGGVEKDVHKEEEAAAVDKDDHKEEEAAAVVKQAKEELAFVEKSGEDDNVDTGFGKVVDAAEAKKTDITSSMPFVIEEEKYDIDVDKDDHKEEEEEAAVEEAKEEFPLLEIRGENYGRNDSLWVEINEIELIDNTSQTSTHSVTEKEENKDGVMEKDQDNLQGVESSHIGSQTEETLPVGSEEPLSQENNCTLQHSVTQIMEEEEEQSNTIKLDNGKTDALYNSSDNYQTTQNSMFWQKGGTNFSRWIMQFRHVVVLLLAFMVLLLFTNHNVLSLSVSFSYS